MSILNRSGQWNEKDRQIFDSQRFENLISAAPQGMHFYYLREDGELIFEGGNPAADRILGLDHQTLVGKAIEEAFPQLKDTNIPVTYKELARSGGKYQDEHIYYKDHQVSGAFEVLAFQISPQEMVATFVDVTEKIRERVETTKSNKYFKTLLENSPIPVFLMDLRGYFELCNQAFCDMLAVTSNQVIGKKAEDFISDDTTIQLFNESLLNPPADGEKLIRQSTILGATDEIHEVMMTLTGFVNPKDQRKSILGFLVDITVMKQAEFRLKLRTEEYKTLNEELQSADEELRVMNEDLNDLNKKLEKQNQDLLRLNEEIRNSEEKFRIAFRTSPDSVNLNRLNDGLYLEINEGFTRITGYSSEDIKGKTSTEINIWAVPEDRKKLVTELLSKGFCENLETVFRMKDGKLIRGVISGRIIELNGEKVILSIARNIESQKRNEDALRESEERFRQLAENTNEVFWLRTRQQILYINQAFRKIWGIDPQEILDNPQRLVDFLHPDDRTGFQPMFYPEELEPGKPFEEQYRIISADGQVRWIWSRVYPVTDEEGVIVRFAGIASDITEQKNIEKELIAAREQAVASDRLKSAFLANISHEIRTPMNGIIGFSELLDNSDLEPDKRKMYVDIVKSSGLQLIRIIDDIIDISKIEANQLKLNFDVCSLQKLMNELLLMYQKQLQQKGIRDVRVVSSNMLSEPAASIITDETRLRQVLINLINNSIKFTEAGEVKFGFDLVNNELKFFVSDTGIGIPEDLHPLIFKRFRQGSETLSRKFGGTGLGLAISEGLVHLLGGRIWFESFPEKGSTFYFSIPYKPAVQQAQAETQTTETVQGGKWTNQHILIAEDDLTNYFYLQNILEPTGARLIHAKNGEEAVKFCREDPRITVVLMDIRMPVLNGYEATRQIRAFRKEIPIIAQTAYAMPEDQIKATQAGCNAYISKPINRHQLMEIMEKYLTN